MNSLLPIKSQMMGVESTNTTRLLNLLSWKADIVNHAVDRTWIIEKANNRSYLQQRISLQQLKMWNTFRTVPKERQLVEEGSGGVTIDVYPGNWTHDTLAAYLNAMWAEKNVVRTITWDPYQLRFIICPKVTLASNSTINSLLGFPEGRVVDANISSFPPMELYGIPYINVYTNFTMNNIPISEYLCSIPVNSKYGEFVFFTNYDNSMSTLVLDPDITNVRVTLTDPRGNLLDYPETLDWDVVLALQRMLPEGFTPLEQ